MVVLAHLRLSPTRQAEPAAGLDLPLLSAARAARRRPVPQLHELRPPLARRDRHARQLRPCDLGARLRRRQRADASRGGASAARSSIERCRRSNGLSTFARAPTRRSASRTPTPPLREPTLRGALRYLAGELLAAYEATASDDWPWFEAGHDLRQRAAAGSADSRRPGAWESRAIAEAGLATLAFYERVTIENGIYVPIGNDGWYPRGGPRARYAQQPLEACAMVDARAGGLRPRPATRPLRQRRTCVWRGTTARTRAA